MPSYLAVTSNSLVWFKSFDVQKSDCFSRDYFRTNQITGSGNYAKVFLYYGKYWGTV